MSRTTRDCRWRFCAIACLTRATLQPRWGLRFRSTTRSERRSWSNGDVAAHEDGRRAANEYRTSDGVVGLLMTNARPRGLKIRWLETSSLAAMRSSNAEITHWDGWPQGRWWNSPLLFWDQFSKSGSLGNTPDPHDKVGVLCVQKTIQPGQSEEFRILPGLAFSESDTGLVRMVGAAGRGEDDHRQLLCRRDSRARGIAVATPRSI